MSFQNFALLAIGFIALLVAMPYLSARLATSNKLNKKIKPLSLPKLMGQGFVAIEEDDAGTELWQRQAKLEAASREKLKDNPGALAIYDQLGEALQ